MDQPITYSNTRSPGYFIECGSVYDPKTKCVILAYRKEHTNDKWTPADIHMSAVSNGCARIYLCPTWTTYSSYSGNDIITMDDNNNFARWPFINNPEWDWPLERSLFTRWPTYGFPMHMIPCYSDTDIYLLEEQICKQRNTPQLISEEQIQQEILAAQAEAAEEAMRPSLIPAEETKIKKKKKSIHININNVATNGAERTAAVPLSTPQPMPSAPPLAPPPTLPPLIIQTMIQNAIATNAICPLTDMPIQSQQSHMIAVTSCGHVFYKPAIKKWLFRDPTCPCCQTYCQVQE